MRACVCVFTKQDVLLTQGSFFHVFVKSVNFKNCQGAAVGEGWELDRTPILPD